MISECLKLRDLRRWLEGRLARSSGRAGFTRRLPADATAQMPRSGLRSTGFCGSLGWFWAYSLTLVAYVKAVGQVEGVLAVMLALWVWREAEVRRQLPGVALVTSGILLVLLGSGLR